MSENLMEYILKNQYEEYKLNPEAIEEELLINIANKVAKPTEPQSQRDAVNILLEGAENSWEKEKKLYQAMNKSNISKNLPETAPWIKLLRNAMAGSETDFSAKQYGFSQDYLYAFLDDYFDRKKMEEILRYISSKEFIQELSGKQKDSKLIVARPSGKKITAFRNMSISRPKTFMSGEKNDFIKNLLSDTAVIFVETVINEISSITSPNTIKKIFYKGQEVLSTEEMNKILLNFFKERAVAFMSSSKEKRESYLLVSNEKAHLEILKNISAELGFEKNIFLENGIQDILDKIMSNSSLNFTFVCQEGEVGTIENPYYNLQIQLVKSSAVKIFSDYTPTLEAKNSKEIDSISEIKNIADFANQIIKVIGQHFSDIDRAELNKLKGPLTRILSSHKPKDLDLFEYKQALFGNASSSARAATIQGSLGEIIGAALIDASIYGIKDYNKNSDISDVKVMGQSVNELSQQAHADIVVSIGAEKIGIQSKQFNANNYLTIQHFYAGQYNLFEDTISRYIPDENIVFYLRYACYQLLLGNNEAEIEKYLSGSFLNFSRIIDIKADVELKNVENNFFLYNLVLIPTSAILCNIGINILTQKPRKKIFDLMPPYFDLNRNTKSSSKKQIELQEVGEEEREENEYLQEVYYDPRTLITIYKKQGGTNKLRLKGPLNFVGLTLDLKQFSDIKK